MRVDDFDFEFDEGLIALEPARPRDRARLLVVPAGGAPFTDAVVDDLPSWLRPGDALVVNDTRVIAAALSGVRHRDGAAAHIAVNLLERIDASRWRALARPAKRLREGDAIRFGEGGETCEMGSLTARVEARGEGGLLTLAFEIAAPDLDRWIEAVGTPPLPPYITARRAPGAADRADYQTMFAVDPGAVAAPTAGLHFTPKLVGAIEAAGASLHRVTLHVGAGTFLPVRVEDTASHEMHEEHGRITPQTAEALNRARAAGGRILAIGTTSLRLLESAACADGTIASFDGPTRIFITPGYAFRAADLLLTNFHLPRSTLFMLVAAFSGLDRMKAAYAHAIGERYRFYSYGDACLLERAR